MKKLILVIMFLSFSVFAKNSMDGIFGFSLADEIDRDGASDLDSDPAIVLGLRYSGDLSKGFGFHSGLTLDSVRDVGSNGKLGFVTLFGNMVYNFKSNSYVFLGLNFPLLIYEDKNLGDIDPVLGVQFGSGYFFTPSLALEILYRTINFEIGNQDSNLWGIGLQMTYKFAQF